MDTYEFMKAMGEQTNRVKLIYSNWAKAHGVNYNVFSVLYTAYKNENCSQKYICEEWGLPKQTVNTTCKTLISQGMISRKQSLADKRECHISLTEKGRMYAAPIVEELLAIEKRVLNRMGEAKVLEFFRLYHTYVGDIEIEFAVPNDEKGVKEKK